MIGEPKVLRYVELSPEEVNGYYDNLLATFVTAVGLTSEQAVAAVSIATGVCRGCMNDNRYDCYCSSVKTAED